MSLLKQGAPRVHFDGIRDLSGRVVPTIRDVEPTHVPLVFLLSEKQVEEPMFLYPSQIDRVLGEKTILRGSKYFSHQTQILEILQKEDNPFLYFPVKIENSKKSFLRLSLLVTDLLPDATGTANTTGKPMKRYKLAWTNGVEDYPEEQRVFGKAKKVELLDNTTLYPILEAEMEFAGEYGNNYGLQISQIPSARLKNNNNTLLLNISLVKKTDTNRYQVIKTVFGEERTVFSFDPEATDNLGRPLQIDKVFQEQYAISHNSVVQNFGEFGKFKVYSDNFEHIQSLIYAEEKYFDNNIPEYFRDKWKLADDFTRSTTINILTGKLPDEETNYLTFTVDKSNLIGLGRGIMASYGDDGFVEEKTLAGKFAKANSILDTFVYELKEEAGRPYSRLDNHDRWDYSIIYDTGFATLAKDTLITINNSRTDITVFYTPMAYGQIEVVPDIEVLTHNGYMRSVNNFQPIPYTRDRVIEVRGLITNLASDRVINEFKILVDDKVVEHTDFLIDSKGYWSANVKTNDFGLKAYNGKVKFLAKIGVKNHDEFPVQEVESTTADYTVLPASLPKANIVSVWENQGVNYSASTPAYVPTKERPGSIVATIISEDGPLEELFEITNARFVFGNGSEVSIKDDFVVWNKPFANPSHATFLKDLEKKNDVKLVFDATDKLSNETREISSPIYPYFILFPDLKPKSIIKVINSGNPIVPNYPNVNNTDTVRVSGEVTGIGSDGLIDLSRVRIKVNGVVVQGVNPLVSKVSPSLTEAEHKYTWYADIPRNYFPVTALDSNPIEENPVTEDKPRETYHAKAIVEAIVDLVNKHQNDTITVATTSSDVKVSDIIGIANTPPTTVDYGSVEQPNININDGIFIKDNLNDIPGYTRIPISLTGSYFDYTNITSAVATIADRHYDIKFNKPFTEAVIYVPNTDLYNGYKTSHTVNVSITTSHASGKDLTFTNEKVVNITYPEAPVYTGSISSVNNGTAFWFDELLSGNRDVVIEGNLPDNVDTLYPITKTVILINGNEHEVNISGTNWSTTLSLDKFDLSRNGDVKLKFEYTSQISKEVFTFTSTGRPYEVRNVEIPTLEIISINPNDEDLTISKPVMWRSDTTDKYINVYVAIKDDADDKWLLDSELFTNPLFTMKKDNAIVRNVIWENAVVNDKQVYLAKVPYSNLLDSQNHFDEDSILSVEASTMTKHNNRSYSLGPDEETYQIIPRTGEVLVEINDVVYDAVDPYEEPDTLFEITGTVSGLVPNQEITNLIVTVGDDEVEVNPTETTYGRKELIDGFYAISYVTKIKYSDLLKGKVFPDTQSMSSISDTDSSSEDITGFYTNNDRVEKPFDEDATWNANNTVEQVEYLFNSIGVTVTTNF